jgi:anti-sigma factor RsiW
MSVDCSQLAELLFDYISGDLPEDQRAVLEEHIRLCPPCLIHVETYRVTITLSRKLPCHHMPADVEQRLRERIARVCPEMV